MSLSFSDATRVERAGSELFEAQIPDTWQQGKGAFGGLVFGTLLRAARAYEEDLTRAPRTLTADVVAPVMLGPIRIHVRMLRRGRSQTNLRLEVEQDDQIVTSALCTLSSTRAVDVAASAPPPPPEAKLDWQAQPLFPLAPPLAPVFTQHYEYRLVGHAPFAGGGQATSSCFLREKAAGPVDAAAAAALLDAPWPSLFGVERRPFPLSTVSFSAQFLPSDAPLPGDVPLFSPGRMYTQHQGYCVELRELWSGDRLVALSQQTIAIVR